MFRDASEIDMEKNNEQRYLPDEIVFDEGVNWLPDEIDMEEIGGGRHHLAGEKLTSAKSSESQNEYRESGESKNNLTGECAEEDPSEKNSDVRNGNGKLNNFNDTGENSKEAKELTDAEINELQQQAIKEAFEKIANGEKLTDAEKGNLGEMLMDQYYTSQGYKPIHSPRVIDLEHKSGQGIDGVYEKINADGSKEYVIADAKVNSSKLNKGLADGTDQMSDAWIEKRLDNAVGKEKADEIRDSYEDNPDSVSKTVYHFKFVGNDAGTNTADVSSVDSDGNQGKDSVMVQIFDQYGNEVDGGVNG